MNTFKKHKLKSITTIECHANIFCKQWKNNYILFALLSLRFDFDWSKFFSYIFFPKSITSVQAKKSNVMIAITTTITNIGASLYAEFLMSFPPISDRVSLSTPVLAAISSQNDRIFLPDFSLRKKWDKWVLSFISFEKEKIQKFWYCHRVV